MPHQPLCCPTDWKESRCAANPTNLFSGFCLGAPKRGLPPVEAICPSAMLHARGHIVLISYFTPKVKVNYLSMCIYLQDIRFNLRWCHFYWLYDDKGILDFKHWNVEFNCTARTLPPHPSSPPKHMRTDAMQQWHSRQSGHPLHTGRSAVGWRTVWHVVGPGVCMLMCPRGAAPKFAMNQRWKEHLQLD